MIRIILACLSSVACLGLFSSLEGGQDQSTSPLVGDDVKQLAVGNSEFAFDLYRTIAANDSDNIVISPYSISTALAMTYAGARGKTAEEMAKVLRISLPGQRHHLASAQVAKDLQGDGKANKCRLDIANSLWGQWNLEFNPDFLNLMKSNYEGGFRQADFALAFESARHEINTWVADKTQQKIKDLIRRGEVNERTKLVLANAVYFKDDWAAPFDKKHTTNEAFQTGTGEKKQVPTMRYGLITGYNQSDGVQVLSLPYRDGRYSMLFVLPDTSNQLSAVEKNLSKDVVAGWIGKLAPFLVHVRVPRFKFTPRYKLGGTLKDMGMSSAFSDDAEFEGILRKPKLALSQVIHQAFVEVDEQGTEAAAATAIIVVTPVSGPPPPPKMAQFIADRPFLAILRENTTGTVLFMVRVVDPEEKPQR